MILQALSEYYEHLLRECPNDVAPPGWCPRQVSFVLDLSQDGELINIIPADNKYGMKRMVPEQVKRTVGIASNLLCDNASYLLGIDAKGKPERAKLCFEAARERHSEALSSVESPTARAVCQFFEKWNSSVAANCPVVAREYDALTGGGNCIFSVLGQEVLKDHAIEAALASAEIQPNENAVLMTCLVTGKQEPIARLHPAIKGVAGAQSMGASLVGFNARAFESYGHDEEQGLNAPVGKRATFAYTTALNYLISEHNHHIRLGDTTIVYWADSSDQNCSALFTDCINPFTTPKEEGDEDPDAKINAVMDAVASGKKIGDASLDATFYVLGIAPNSARLSIRFFLRNTFGSVLKNLERHYRRLDIEHGPKERQYLSPYQLLRETENPNAKHPAATSILAGTLMRSILTDSRYPEALYTNVLLRIRASQDDEEKHTRKVTRGRAAIIKAYLIKNEEEAMTVALDEKRRDAPYVLGRLFSVLEAVQGEANPGINTTIKNRYFNSACSTPSTIFPIIMKLGQNHLNKISGNSKSLAVYYEKQIQDICDELPGFPKRLSLAEQGDFILGYYCQTQKRYKKKSEQEA